MKLIRLKLNIAFHGLPKGFEIDFLHEHEYSEYNGEYILEPYILAGRNGSGKSNLLEVLAAIFYHLECSTLQNLPDSFVYDPEDNKSGFQSRFAEPDAFELEYFIGVENKLKHVRVKKEIKTKPKWEIKKDDDFDEIKGHEEIRSLLPDFVLAYSSGENEILSLPFFKMRFIQYDEYLSALLKETSYPGQPESRLMFLDNEFSQAILLCNLLMQEKNELSALKEEIGISNLLRFRIIINKRIELTKSEVTNLERSFSKDEEVDLTHLIEKDKDEFDEEYYYLPVLKLFEFESKDDNKPSSLGAVNRFIRCATCHSEDENVLFLDYWVNEATQNAFEANFSSAIDLFQVFQVLFTLNLYSVDEQLKKDVYTSDSLYVNETIPNLPSDKRIFRFKDFYVKKIGTQNPLLTKNLSDGEHQLLHSMGLCMLYREKDCLFLLDEPETHFNPDWRAKFITSLRKSLKSGSDKQGHSEFLITTHTPFLISDSKKEKVLVFKKEGKLVQVERPEYETFGASVNKITMETFEKKETIGGHAQLLLERLQEEFADGENKEKLISKINEQLGDSVEKILLIDRILDSMEEEN